MIRSFISAILMFSMAACAKEELLSDSSVSSTIQARFRLDMSSSGQNALPSQSRLNAYVFDQDLNEEWIFSKGYRGLTPGSNGEIELVLNSTSRIFFYAGDQEPNSLASMIEGKTLQSYLKESYTNIGAVHEEVGPPTFFSTEVISLTPEDLVNKILLRRSVARVDINTTRDDKIEVSRIVVEDAPARTKIFPSEELSLSETKKSYDRTFATPIKGEHKDLFRIYESADPVKLTVYGMYESRPIVAKATIPKVERSKVYTIRLFNAGSEISGSFDMVPWEEGENSDAFPDASKKIVIDAGLSVLPADAEIIAGENRVEVLGKGGELTLAFRAVSQVQLASVEGQHPDITVTDLNSPEIVDDAVVSKIKVQISPQKNGRLAYAFILNLRSALQQGIYDQVRVRVEKSEHQIPTVTLGGVTWMAFNARTPNLDDQVYCFDGVTVEEMYNNSWLSTVGGLFQWGRQHMYTPWFSGKHNAGGQQQNSPWTARTHVPCPDGYRIPKIAELAALLPHNQAVPGSYKYGDEMIDVALHTSTESAVTAPSGVRGTARYISLTSRTSGNKMFIPLSGSKGDKSGSNNPSFGQSFTLWTNSNAGVWGGYASIRKFHPGNATTGTMSGAGDNSQLQAEAFAYLRCIKE